VSASSPAIPFLEQFADLALWEAELVADQVAVESALMAGLRSMPDRRAQRGLRHPLLAILVLAACTTLVVGGIWAVVGTVAPGQACPHPCHREPLTGRFEVSSEPTFGRVPADLDTDALGVRLRGGRHNPDSPRDPARSCSCGARGATLCPSRGRVSGAARPAACGGRHEELPDLDEGQQERQPRSYEHCSS
jgi:hypothetical protein